MRTLALAVLLALGGGCAEEEMTLERLKSLSDKRIYRELIKYHEPAELTRGRILVRISWTDEKGIGVSSVLETSGMTSVVTFRDWKDHMRFGGKPMPKKERDEVLAMIRRAPTSTPRNADDVVLVSIEGDLRVYRATAPREIRAARDFILYYGTTKSKPLDEWFRQTPR